ncbi:hypothetical protein BC629DRAFT_1443720 [Irpex lacteus]|nr:hypothetical protein BC629DRAFT_1443720 [Irpex lacteus]
MRVRKFRGGSAERSDGLAGIDIKTELSEAFAGNRMPAYARGERCRLIGTVGCCWVAESGIDPIAAPPDGIVVRQQRGYEAPYMLDPLELAADKTEQSMKAAKMLRSWEVKRLDIEY